VQPTKPSGRSNPRFRAAALERDHGWSMAEDAGAAGARWWRARGRSRCSAFRRCANCWRAVTW
jgi:hypothetical protein